MQQQNISAFDSFMIGNLKLRNRFIRSAAFEGMCQQHLVTDDLIQYHQSLAKGGVGMTTVAYAAVSKSGLSFHHQLWLRNEIIPDLKKLTGAVHHEGAAASIQIGHTGNMSKKSITGTQPIAPCGGFNIYGPSWPRRMKSNDIETVTQDFANAVRIAKQAGFDAVEIHAGHGYLVSQFLSPYTNKRKDGYGGSFENRSRFLREVLTACVNVAANEIAVIVKMNMYDGFEDGITREEALAAAKLIEECGADAIVLSGGFVSRSPLYIMRGQIPPKTMSHYIKNFPLKILVRYFGKQLMQPIKFEEGYFLQDALAFRNEVKIPLIVVGGLNSETTIQRALEMGFEGIGLARALIQNPNFVNELKKNSIQKSACTICNYCVAVMYSHKMQCYMNDKNIPQELMNEITQSV
jgi:2,4-dienoyl-CoA reductase-like NADH-dependent reductase (Old Yellow Enzyme family)